MRHPFRRLAATPVAASLVFLASTCSSPSPSHWNPSASSTPELHVLTPDHGLEGTLVEAAGSGFGSSPGRIALAGVPVGEEDLLSWSETSILFWVPAGASTGDVTVTADGNESNGCPFTVTGPDPAPPPRTDLHWSGALDGKRAVVSPGHGYYYDTGQSAWITQRLDCWGLVEDRHNNEIAMDFLIPMLERAGARVISCRERSRQEHEAIVDDGDGAPDYTEWEAFAGTWTTTASSGLGYAGTDYRYAYVNATETATATWTPVLPADGVYPVYVWFRANANRADDVLYRIDHAGGTTEVRVNQRIFGSRWFHLGDFFFHAGASGSITLSNASADAGQVVIADAVRVGGGMGSISRGGSTSGKARWRECARYWTEFMGAPSSVWDLGMSERHEDITCRAHYADWMEDEWAGQGGAVYLSIHTNAARPPNTGSGTDTFIHDTAPSPGSAAFQDVLHPQVVGDIRALWKSDWIDRGQKTAYFGELRETDDMPACLIELAFHDTETPDNDFLHEDEFRRDVARALYKGISKYLNPAGAIAPLPPTHLRVESLPFGRIRVSWRARNDPLETSASPTAYVVYTSTDGRAFDNGRVVTSTSLTIGHLIPGQVYFFRVAATNAGGESLPTEVLCARARSDNDAPLLLVNGFDRLDRYVTLRRRENTFDYVRQHAEAVAGAGDVAFDSASNEAVADGDLALDDYGAVDWILGEESTADETFSASEQGVAMSYLSGGGSLLVTGAEIAWDLGHKGSASDQSFLSGTLHATYVEDAPGAGVYSVDPVSGSIFDGMSETFFDDGTHGTYDVDYADVLAPSGSASACLLYHGTGGKIAGIAWDGGGPKLVYLGFPLEAVWDASSRTTLMSRILGHLLP